MNGQRKIAPDDKALSTVVRRFVTGGPTGADAHCDELVELIKEASDGQESEASIRRIIAKREVIRAFGAIVRDCRRARNLTQGQLALSAQVSKSTIVKIETGMLDEGPQIGTLTDLLFIMNQEMVPTVKSRRFLCPIESDHTSGGSGDVPPSPGRRSYSARGKLSGADDNRSPDRPARDADLETGDPSRARSGTGLHETAPR